MKVAAAVLTHNPSKHERMNLLRQTVTSLQEADAVYLVDNGSTDISQVYLRDTFGDLLAGIHRNETQNTTSGFGTHLCLRVLAASGADVCVVSDDDMAWGEGWREELEAFWFDAPDSVLIAGGHIEPAFHWNDIVKVHDGWLERESTGAASWTTTRPQLLAEIGARVSMLVQGSWDVPVCRLVRSEGYKIGQLNLAEHVGEVSTWGNGTIDHYGWAVDPIKDLLR